MNNFMYLFLIGMTVFYSTLNAQWSDTNGLPGNNGYVRTFAVSGANLFAGNDDGNGVYLSTNDGISWSSVNSGLTERYVEALLVKDTNLFAGTGGGGVFRSTNNGISWTSANYGLMNLTVWSFAFNGTNLFAGTADGVFLSTNIGSNWISASNGLTNTDVRNFAVIGSNLFAGTFGGGVFLSTNNGTGWTSVSNGLNDNNIISLAAVETDLYAGTFGHGIYRSTNNGTSWTQVNNGLTYYVIYSFARSGTNLFAGTLGGVFLSTNSGANWTDVSNGLTNIPVSLAVSGTNLFAGTDSNNVWRRPLSEMITDVENQSGGVSVHFVLEQNFPNPFNPNTSITFSIPKEAQVNLSVYNILGEKVKELKNEVMKPGYYELEFNATSLASSVYFYRIKATPVGGQAGDPSTGLGQVFVQTKKMILLK